VGQLTGAQRALMNKQNLDQFVWSMFLLWARVPRKPEPDTDGMYDLSEIGHVREKNFKRATPYSQKAMVLACE
jgi:hypothetical protein